MKSIAAVILSLTLSACVSNPPRPVVQIVKYDLRVNQSSRDEIFSDDVGISLKPIMLEKAVTTESLFASYNYWNPSNPKQNGKIRSILVSLPVFEVQVTNTSGQAVSFQKVAIRLVDDAGNSYQAQLKQDIIDFAGTQLDSMQSRGWAMDRAVALGAARNLKLLDKNYESLPGIIEKRILSFDIGNISNDNAYREMFKNTKYVRAMIYNVPVKFDQAGNVTKVAKFDFLFDVIKK
ncbi:hypothetical protein [Polaromonas naphthalenivorans]|uniref:hypothetical protein n=1 Tax=Polaromonas naphthalenivorans TaxID=216465 RepID=UPI000068053B|nr:hypothetical protein [Polaromonas naphthalenivorans]